MAVSDLSATNAAARLGRVPKSTLRAHIAEQLRAAILAGDIAPGSPLVETALSRRFEVSRGPLREALRQLVEEGLLVTVPYTGTHVASLSVEDVHEIYSLRTALETFAFELVWPRRDDRFRRELRQRNDGADRHHRCRRRPRQHRGGARVPRSGLRGERPPAAAARLARPCVADCSSIGRRIIAPTAAAGRGATATTATSKPRWVTTSTRCAPRSPITCAAARNDRAVPALDTGFVWGSGKGDVT